MESNNKNKLSPELVEKYKMFFNNAEDAEKCAQIAVEYAFETFVPLNQELKNLKQQRDELINGIKEVKQLILSIDGKHLSFDDLKHDIIKEVNQLLKNHEDGKS